MLLPSLFELFCSYNCDGPTAMVLRRGKNVSVHTTAMLLPSLFERFCDGPTATVFVKGNWLVCACDGAMVQLRWFLLREIGLSVQTTAMLLPSQGNK
nr:hypothetical protein Q903MT_gene4925 [Picea sitchensis]